MARWIVIVLAAASTACGLLMGDLSYGDDDDEAAPRGGEGAGGGGSSGRDGDLTATSTSGGSGGGDGNTGSPTTSDGGGVPSGPASGNDAGTSPTTPGTKDAAAPAPTERCKTATFNPSEAWAEPDGPAPWSTINAVMVRGSSGYAHASLDGTTRSERLVIRLDAGVPANAQIKGFRATVWHMDNREVAFVAPSLRLADKTLSKTTNDTLSSFVSSFGGDDDLWGAARVQPSSLSKLELAFSVQGLAGGAIATKTAAIDGVAVSVRYCVVE